MKISYLKQIKKRIREGDSFMICSARPLDLRLCQALLVGDDFIYGTRTYRNYTRTRKQHCLQNLVDIITGHETGELIRTFCMMVGLSRFQYLYQPDYQLRFQLDQYESRCGY